MSESEPIDVGGNKSPIANKVAVATKHPGVFMETSEFEAETGTKIQSRAAPNKRCNSEDDDSCDISFNEEDKEKVLEVTTETPMSRKRALPRSRRKRVDRLKVKNIYAKFINHPKCYAHAGLVERDNILEPLINNLL